MEDNEKLLFEISDLTIKAYDGSLTDSEFEYLQHQIRSNPKAAEYYCDFVSLFVNIDVINEMDLNTPDITECFNDFFQQMAEYEKIAPAVTIPPEKPKPELIQKVVYPPRQKIKLNLFHKLTFAATAAAIIFIALFLRFAPAPLHSVDVAALVDQMNVQWAKSNDNFKNGRRLWTEEGPYELKKGVVKIQYDDGVKVMVEGPAVFQIQRTGIYLEYGRLYSHVSPTGLGFKVETPTSQFIDMGTEFGVQADVNGSSELHVTKGKVQLFAGISKQSKTGQMITEKQAVRFNANNSEMKSIPFEEKAFVRQFDSKTGMVLRGQKPINPDLRLALVDDMQAYSDESQDFHGAATPGEGGMWDTNASLRNPTANIRTDEIDGSMVLRIRNYSGGTARGAGIHSLSDPIYEGRTGIAFFRFLAENSTRENLQFMGLHQFTGANPITPSNNHRDNVTAGFGLVDNNSDPGGTTLDIITTDERPVVLGHLEQGQWYDVWIVADHAADTFDLYIRASAGPGTGDPGLPHSNYLIDSGIPFGIQTTDALTGMMFLCDEASGMTAGLWIDDFYWIGSTDI